MSNQSTASNLNVRLIHLVRRAHRGFYRGLQLRLAERGIMMGHWIFLRLLWENERLTQKELSERASLRAPTTFNALKGMEKLGLVKRRVNPKDRRAVQVSLTKRGRDLQSPLVSLAYEMNEIALLGLSAKTVSIVRDALETMIENLEIAEVQRRNGKLRHGKGAPRLDSKNPAVYVADDVGSHR